MSYSADPRAVRSREAMLAAARRLLAEEGLDAVTHQRVAQEAGVGRATVYRHWPRTDQLLLDAMLDRAADLAEKMVGEGPDAVVAKATAPKKPAGRNR